MATTKYKVLIDDLCKKIADGTYPPMSQLPTAHELCESYGVSRITVNKAMEELDRLGLISRKRGSGTYVKSSVDEFNMPAIWEISSKMGGGRPLHEQLGHHFDRKVHTFSVIEAPDEVKEMLDLKHGFVYEIIRSSYSDGVPIGYETTYMPISLIPDLSIENVRESIYKYIEGTLGLVIASGNCIISAVPASKEESTQLGIPENTPMLEVKQTGYLDTGEIFEYSIVHHTPQDFPLHTVRYR